jgi:GTP-binding protein EngB required for normal cell division
VYLLLDARRGIMQSDLEMMQLLDKSKTQYMCVLAKADSLLTAT